MDCIAKISGLFERLDKNNIEKIPYGENNDIFAKVENKNLTGSIKDRPALQMMLDAAKEGLIKEDTVFIEATSGNMGISISYLAREIGLKALIVMPSSMSVERREMIKRNGGELLLIEGGMKQCEEEVENLLKTRPNFLKLSQFENLSNPKAHYLTTAPEIQRYGHFDYIVMGIGTGGTISGIGGYFKEKGFSTKIIGVEPEASPLLTKGQAGPHKIQGIGANFIPKTLNKDIVDEIIDVDGDKAILLAKDLKEKGISVGISSGAALLGALEIDKKTKGKKILVIFPDNGDRYHGII
ncbi:MAG: cysteine synthase family protein [Bacilli bacterium]|nr:cysteine synthase family protein [Bacilli bacterium]